MRFGIVPAVVFGIAAFVQAGEPYHSPYEVKYTHSITSLVGDLDGERGDRRRESSVPHAEWYSPKVKERWRAWGPPARHYPAPPAAAGKSADWKRERVIATAMRFHGYEYQHHHVPDWNPPAGWPWLKVGVGRNGKGFDCSNFTAFVYNLAFGIKPTGAIREQSEQLALRGPDGKEVRAERIEHPGTYAGLVKALKTGDLLYVKGRPDGVVTHVVIWVGAVGRSPDGVPLVLDSHGADTKDANGALIPAGVYLRPFRPNSWYYRSASHAHRLIRD